MAKQKASEAWDTWLNTLSPEARKAINNDQQTLETVDDAAVMYAGWRSGLSPSAQRAVDALVEPVEPADTRTSNEFAGFCVVEVPNGGDWPTLRLFRDVENVVRHMANLEGSDVSLFVFYGVRMPFTRGPRRYLLLPDRVTAISVPLATNEPSVRVDFDSLDNVELQEDHFLGCKELSETDAGPAAPSCMPHQSRGGESAPESSGDDPTPAK